VLGTILHDSISMELLGTILHYSISMESYMNLPEKTAEEQLVIRLLGMCFSHVTINLNAFVTLLRSEAYWYKYGVKLDPTTDREILRTFITSTI